ncbi:MAG: hypothetical protein BGP10_08140 [Rhodanobacter sp. 68-29]|nr:TonB-dependent receptor [Rhodanobacter sp.]ODU75691.1 MAG: hypothetical protein ABT17_02975 [Rhodanobacter sp. SCN 69-32]OJY56978.1 MAG: hypothetical protein BGP10_08140 [Rhodanobacter sp. 68-29]
MACCAALLPCLAQADQPVHQLGEVVVVGVTPLPGLDLPLAQVPLNVQVAQADDLQQIHGQSLTDLLARDFQGVNLTQSQGNPWQSNLYFHGFTLSPLQGSPSGLSIYLDGVRQNESFAATMNWEAIPDFAIRNVALIPSSNPLYGLNTLGGSLVLTSKSGFTDPGGSFSVTGGSWGRIQADADFGAHGDTFGFYAGVGSDYESGWRAHSSSRVQQGFLRLDWHPDAATAIALSYAGTHATLFGTQTLPVEWADTPAAAYTWPDHFTDNINQFNLRGTRELGGGWSLQASAYLRLSQSRSFNSNVNAYDGYDDDDGPLGYAVDGPFDSASVGQYYYTGLSPAFDPRNPGATINNVPAANVLGNVHTRGYGASVQAVDDSEFDGHRNRLTVGASLDGGSSRFTQYGQPAYFPYDVAQRGNTVGLLPFELDPMTAAATGTRSYGVYFMDVLALTDALHVSAGGRYDHSRIGVSDLSGNEPAIDGRNGFHRFNPSLGATWSLSARLNAYLNYDEGMRAPTPIELECADPAAPCALPNDFTSDPPLKPVVAHTFSAGLRGTLADGRLRWNVSPYYSRVSNDILTIHTGGSAQGYFANVPRTVRKGVDAGFGGQSGRFEWQVDYSFVAATYGAPFAELSEDNSSADRLDAIQVRRGDRIPGIPRQMGTLAGEYHFTPQWSLGANLRACAGQYATGDENNQDAHGRLPGYALLDLDLHWRPVPALTLFVQVQNVFDRRYFASGQLGSNVFDTPDRLVDTNGPGTSTLFVAPGAPRAWFAGLQYDFGRRLD